MGVKACSVCGARFDARGNMKRCPSCRAARSVRAAVEASLREAGKRDTAMGEAALVLAARLDAGTDPGSAMAAMAKELRTTMTELTRGVSAVADPVDELRRRRERRLSG